MKQIIFPELLLMEQFSSNNQLASKCKIHKLNFMFVRPKYLAGMLTMGAVGFRIPPGHKSEDNYYLPR